MSELSDDEIRRAWREAGGSFFGPRVEHASMEEQKFLAFMRALYARATIAEAAVLRDAASALEYAYGHVDSPTADRVKNELLPRMRSLIPATHSPAPAGNAESEALRVALTEAREFVAMNLAEFLECSCLHDDEGNPRRDTLDEDDKPEAERVEGILVRIDAALSTPAREGE